MTKRAVFKGKGEIEFNLPSKSRSITLKKGQSVDITDIKDIKVVKALRSLELYLEDVKAEAPVAEAPVAEAPVAEAPVAEAPVAEAEKQEDVKYTFEELHSRRAEELRALAKELSIELKDGASKKEMANEILKKLGE